MNRLLKKSLAWALALLLTILTGCSCPDPDHQGALYHWMTPNGKVKILSTTAMIDDLVRQVGGEYVDTMVLIKGELDPHSYQLVKGDDEKISFADLIFYNGLGLEHGPSLQNALSKKKNAVPLGNKIQETMPDLILHYKGQVDPHVWMDVSLWAKTIPHIVSALSQKDPSRAETYRENGNRLLDQMEGAHQEIKQILHQIPPPKRYLVTSHDAFNYFTRAYLAENGEGREAWLQRFAAPEGLAPESQISTTDIQAIISHLMQYRIHILFAESNVNPDSIRKIIQAAKEKGLNVAIATTYLYADAMGKPGSDADSYLKMIHHNAVTIAQNLHVNGN
jgi:manganese/zinc/iron transport system substrate-binding protein